MQVVAVGADAGDPQRQRQLGRARATVDHGHARRRRSVEPAPSRRGRAPRAAPSRSTPAAANCSASTTPASERRSILRRWPNAVRTSANSALGRRRRAAARRTISTSADSTFGRGTNTDAGTCADDPRRRPVRDLHADRAVRRRARRRRRGARRPRAAPSRASARSPARRRAGRRRAAWRRCTAGWRRAPSRSSPPSSVVPVERHRVGLDDRDVGALGDDLAQHRRRGRGRPRPR